MNNKSFSKILLAIILITISLMYLRLFTGVSYKKIITANSGYCDLSLEDFQRDIIILDGEWEFYPNQLKSSGFSENYYIQVPKEWNEYTYDGKKNSSFGTGTYKLRLKVPKKGVYSLSIGCVFSAYKLIINNEEIITNGTIGNSYENEVASWQQRVIPFYTESEDVEIIVQVSNYHNNKGGMTKSILFGSYETINNNSVSNIIKSAMVIGVFAGIGFYLVLIYKSEGKKYTYFYLALFCISSLILESIIDASIIYYIFNDISFNIVSKLEYIAYMGEMIALQLFIKSIYPKESSKFNFMGISIINGIYLLMIVITPIIIFGYSTLIYVSILLLNCIVLASTLVKSIIKKRKFAMLFLVGMFIMLLTTVVDIMYVNNYANIYFTSGNYVVGLIFFLLCQIYVMSSEVKEAFENSNKAKDMEIAFLQAQIAPHFFFNTLNNIYCLMEESVSKASDLILDFCDFLRVKHKFDYRKNIFYSLREEIGLIESYVKIENARLDSLINLVIDINEEDMSTPIPQLLIQPIVENCIKHGSNFEYITITISALRKNDNLEITVADNGKGIDQDILNKILDDKGKTLGVGLRNVNFRLDKCYNSKLKVLSELSHGTTVSFEISLEMKV